MVIISIYSLNALIASAAKGFWPGGISSSTAVGRLFSFFFYRPLTADRVCPYSYLCPCNEDNQNTAKLTCP